MKWYFLIVAILSGIAVGFYWHFGNVKAMIGYGIIVIINLMYAGFVRLEEVIKGGKE